MSQEKSSTKLEEGGRREEDPVPQEQLGLDPLFWTALVARVNALHRRVVCHEKFPGRLTCSCGRRCLGIPFTHPSR